MTDWCIPDSTVTVDGAGAYSGVQPGDRLLVPSTRTTILKIRNFTGTAAKPIIIINADGRVTIDDGSWVGFLVEDCEYIRITGTGDPAYPYGFRFRNFTNAGIRAIPRVRYVEIDHVETGPGLTGIRVKTDQVDAPPGWIQYSTTVHHCYVHDCTGTAMYLGDAQSGNTSGFHVYQNYVYDIGSDGIQISGNDTDPDTDIIDIHHNRVFLCGTNPDLIPANPGAGIEIRRWCNDSFIYKNYVENCRVGIRWTNTGARHQCFNNVVVDCGQNWGEMGGIQLYDSGLYGNGSLIDVYQNHVLNAEDWGIKVSDLIASGTLEGNLVCGTDSGNHINNSNPNVTESDNQEIADCANAGMVDYAGGDYHLEVTSVCVDAYSSAGADDDFDGVARPQGDDHDVGAYEFYAGLARDDDGSPTVTVTTPGTQVTC